MIGSGSSCALVYRARKRIRGPYLSVIRRLFLPIMPKPARTPASFR